MVMSIRKFGDWDKLSKGLARINSQVDETKTRVVKKAAVIGQTLIRKNLVSGGALVGKPFEPNSAVTVDLKGSSKPLIDTGDMMGSVGVRMIDSETATVGVLKETVSGVSIGWLHEKGTNRAGRGNKVTIPPRPWITPVAESQMLQDKVREMAEQELKDLVGDLL